VVIPQESRWCPILCPRGLYRRPRIAGDDGRQGLVAAPAQLGPLSAFVRLSRTRTLDVTRDRNYNRRYFGVWRRWKRAAFGTPRS
jgi:hypothetical protein